MPFFEQLAARLARQIDVFSQAAQADYELGAPESSQPFYVLALSNDAFIQKGLELTFLNAAEDSRDKLATLEQQDWFTRTSFIIGLGWRNTANESRAKNALYWLQNIQDIERGFDTSDPQRNETGLPQLEFIGPEAQGQIVDAAILHCTAKLSQIAAQAFLCDGDYNLKHQIETPEPLTGRHRLFAVNTPDYTEIRTLVDAAKVMTGEYEMGIVEEAIAPAPR